MSEDERLAFALGLVHINAGSPASCLSPATSHPLDRSLRLCIYLRSAWPFLLIPSSPFCAFFSIQSPFVRLIPCEILHANWFSRSWFGQRVAETVPFTNCAFCYIFQCTAQPLTHALGPSVHPAVHSQPRFCRHSVSRRFITNQIRTCAVSRNVHSWIQRLHPTHSGPLYLKYVFSHVYLKRFIPRSIHA